MKLIEKFETWLNTNPRKEIRAIQCEVIAEDFAIGFAEWLRNECYDTGLKWYYQKDNEEYTSTELLEIYKKEKGL